MVGIGAAKQNLLRLFDHIIKVGMSLTSKPFNARHKTLDEIIY